MTFQDEVRGALHTWADTVEVRRPPWSTVLRRVERDDHRRRVVTIAALATTLIAVAMASATLVVRERRPATTDQYRSTGGEPR